MIPIRDQGQELCLFGIMPAPNMYIFGDVFLRKYYSIYDFERSKVGLALAVHQGQQRPSILRETFEQLTAPHYTYIWVSILTLSAITIVGVMVYVIVQLKKQEKQSSLERNKSSVDISHLMAKVKPYQTQVVAADQI